MSQWQLLSVFNAVVEEGSFSGAAKRLDLSQPTVSFHIDNLEKSFGCALFQRTGRGVVLTAYGELLFSHTSKIDTQLETAHKQIKAMLQGKYGEMIIGASTIPAEYILPGLIAEFLRDRPELRILLQVGSSKTILAGFTAGDYPIAIVGMHPGNEHKVLDLWPDEMVLIAHPDIRAVLGEKPALETILAYPFVSRLSTSGSLQTVHNALKERGASPNRMRVVLEVNSNEAIKAAVLNKIGLGYVSKWAVQEELYSGRLAAIQIPGFTITRQFYAVCQDHPLLNCFHLFWEFLQRTRKDQAGNASDFTN